MVGERRPAPPQPTPASGRGCLWLVTLLCLVVIGVFAWNRLFPRSAGSRQTSQGAPRARSVTVAVATARRGDLPIYLDAPGTVIALNSVTVRSRVDGQIMSVNFEEGAFVREGDLLFEIDPRPFEAQLLQAQGALARDQALLENARRDYARYREAGRAATQQQLETARANVAQYEGVIEADRGQIETVKLQLTYCRITAPISGRIGLRAVDIGNIVHASDAGGLTTITQIQPITVVFSLAQDYLPRILKADAASHGLEVHVLNRDKSIQLTTGTLSAVDSQIDLPTLTARFKATFMNENRILFPNQAVNVRLLVETRKGVVLVPTAAVQHSPQTAFAYVVRHDKTVEMRPIKTGPVEGDVALVEQGVAPGEVVVTAGVDNLAPGMRVNIPAAERQQATPAGVQPVPTQTKTTKTAAQEEGSQHMPAVPVAELR